MKKNLFLLVVAMLAMPAMFAQTKNVARECVLFELMTGVYCGNCPGAEEGIDDMLADGMAIAPVCYQDDYFSEPSLYTDEIQRRVDYYPHAGCPTLIVDGMNSLPGGGSNTYYYYQPYYQNRIGVTSPFTITMTLDAVEGDLYRVNCQVEQVGDCNGSDVRVFIALTQDHLAYSWQGMSELNHLVRDLIPTEEGTPFEGPKMDVIEEFEIAYPLEDCHLVAWVQDFVGNKEVYQAVTFETSLADVVETETLTDAVYPNPSNGTFNLSLGEGQWDVEVYDLTGRKVYENRLDGQSAIDLSSCQKGIYFLKAKNESEEITSKLVIR